jgi:peroxin-5
MQEAQNSATLESTAVEGDMETGRWEAELSELMNRYREDGEYDYGKDLQEAWEGGMGNLNAEVVDGSVSFDEQGLPVLEPYKFDPNNRFLGQSSSRSFLQDAKNLLESGGSLGEVGLLLEAAIQRGELGQGGYETWLLLGETKSMDEREESAMQAFSEGVRIAQANGGSGAGMLSLAISFTNEGYERASYSMLLQWLRSRFPDHPIPAETIQSITKSAWHSQPLITDAYLDLARSQHAQGVVDADVQIALGVLFYSRSDYEHAKDCFQSALALRPDDFRLWNRFGSCLSNGNQPEESLSAYREALRLRPTYTRAVYNVAVACMNIGANKEAAEHLLDALSSQSDGAGTTSEQLWTTLKRAFNNMDRPDLADLANGHPPVDVFRKEGFEFSAPKGGLPPPPNPSA